MSTIWIKEFIGGLDTRRLAATTPGGVLLRATDGHITRGGEFEKRAKFEKVYDLPEGTVGLAANDTGLVVFGSAADPGVPSGVTYNRLQNGAKELARVLSYDLYDDAIYAVAEYSDGVISHFLDEAIVTDWFDGRARFAFDVTGGGSGNTLDSITVGGIEVLNSAVSWDTDTDTTAANIAAQIVSYNSSPEYTAVAVGNRVTVIASTAGTAANGLAVVLTTTGLTVSPTSGSMADGAASSTTFQPGAFVSTHIGKMFALSGKLVHFSGLDQPTQFTTDYTGAGFIDMSRQARLAGDLVSIAPYQQYLAIFAGNAILVYFFDPDPTLTRKSQVLNNTGTDFRNSVSQFGDADVFYLHGSGIRSLRARDSSNAAATSDIGIPIDTLVQAAILNLSGESLHRVFALTEPRDGRFWQIIDDEIFVFSYFPGSKVSAWTKYEPGFSVDGAVLFDGKVWLRAGDEIYVYGGTGAALEYDATEAEARLPYLDAETPTEDKDLTGIDVAASGVWECRVGMDSNDEEASDLIAVVEGTSYRENKLTANGRATQFSPRFRSKGTGPAILGSVAIHYDKTSA